MISIKRMQLPSIASLLNDTSQEQITLPSVKELEKKTDSNRGVGDAHIRSFVSSTCVVTSSSYPPSNQYNNQFDPSKDYQQHVNYHINSGSGHVTHSDLAVIQHNEHTNSKALNNVSSDKQSTPLFHSQHDQSLILQPPQPCMYSQKASTTSPNIQPIPI